MDLPPLGPEAARLKILFSGAFPRRDRILQPLLDLFHVLGNRLGRRLEHLRTTAKKIQTRLARGLVELGVDAPAIGADCLLSPLCLGCVEQASQFSFMSPPLKAYNSDQTGTAMAAETDTFESSIADDLIARAVSKTAPTRSDLSALYSENGSIARAIMEWRHRVITLYVLTLGAVGSAVLWLQNNNALQNVPLLFSLASVVLCVLGLMDHTNARILGACYRVGDSIERALGTDGAIYAALHARRQSRRTITYTRLMYVLTFGSATMFLGVALYFIWQPLP